jgi:hypothetical protein
MIWKNHSANSGGGLTDGEHNHTQKGPYGDWLKAVIYSKVISPKN